jgi:hypothetical protein
VRPTERISGKEEEMKNIFFAFLAILILEGCSVPDRIIPVEGTVVIGTAPVGRNGSLAYYLETSHGVLRVDTRKMIKIGEKRTVNCEVFRSGFDGDKIAGIINCAD